MPRLTFNPITGKFDFIGSGTSSFSFDSVLLSVDLCLIFDENLDLVVF